MVTCPRCGRKFKDKIRVHYCGDKPNTIDEYIAKQPEDIQFYLIQVRKAIRDAVPEAEERISLFMPTFWNGHNFIYFYANKDHMAIEAGEEAVAELAEMLQSYKIHKGTIEIPYKEPLPLDLIAHIAVWVLKNEKD